MKINKKSSGLHKCLNHLFTAAHLLVSWYFSSKHQTHFVALITENCTNMRDHLIVSLFSHSEAQNTNKSYVAHQHDFKLVYQFI